MNGSVDRQIAFNAESREDWQITAARHAISGTGKVIIDNNTDSSIISFPWPLAKFTNDAKNQEPFKSTSDQSLQNSFFDSDVDVDTL